MSDQVLNDYVKTIRDDLLMESPFVEDEITDRVIEKAITRSLGKMDLYRPQIKTTYGPVSNPDYTMLRTYTSRFNDLSMYNYHEELDVEIGDRYVYAVKWKLDELIVTPAYSSQFRDLVVAYSCMFMANFRRTANFSNTPFDLKGDQFFQEYKDKYDKTIELMINTTPNNL